MKLSDTDWALIIVGAVIVGVAGYLAVSFDSGDIISQPEFQTEVQFAGLDVKAGYNNGTMLDMTPARHFYHPGYDPDETAQKLVTSRHRYPVVSGGNLSTVMHSGFDSMRKASPDNPWRVTPPSEATI